MMYQAREDSLFLSLFVKKYAQGTVLDMGTGSGVLALAAVKKAKKIIGADIDKDAIAYCKEHTKNRKSTFIQSDLFSNIKGKYDVIIFNPPYLPEDPTLKDLTVDGGKRGYEVTERFLSEANGFLKPNGCILLLFSSLTNKNKMHEILEHNLFRFTVLGEKPMFFETLYVYKIEKNHLLKKLEKKGVTHIKYLTKGHRGILFTGYINKIKVVIKVKRPDSKAVGRVANEATSLRLINKKGIGPRLLFYTEEFLVYEYVDGSFIIDFLKKSNKRQILAVLTYVFRQCFLLDKLGFDKEEMHHPLKHILVGKKKVLIDFERMHKTQKPKNVTQFCQFLMSNYLRSLFISKGIVVDRDKIIRYAQEYKHTLSRENFIKIVKCFT